MTKKNLLIAAYALGAAALLASILYALAIKDKGERTSGIKTKFDELEFVVVHRPYLTYFVDVKYLVCFATHKPEHQGLVEFRCPDRLLQEATGDFMKPIKKKKEKRGIDLDGDGKAMALGDRHGLSL